METATRKSYPTDLSDKEWALLEPLLPPPKHTGRKRKYEMREIANAVFYLLRTGCPWRMLPHDLPPWQAVYQHFRRWRSTGVWQQLNDTFRIELRVLDGREGSPSAAVMDSQSVKTSEKGGLAAMMAQRK
jgi:putative transposase